MHGQPPPDTRSRAERLRDDGIDPVPMPPITAGMHLLEWFLDVGPVAPGAMGPVPIGYTDLQAWAQLSGTPLQPWQAATLRRMSRAYAAELRAAEAHDAPPPWASSPTQQQRDIVQQRLQQAMAGRSTNSHRKGTP